MTDYVVRMALLHALIQAHTHLHTHTHTHTHHQAPYHEYDLHNYLLRAVHDSTEH